MKPQHTPGPWEADKWATGYEISGDCRTIAKLADTDNVEVNAALIAAAPELLEALKTCEDTFRWALKQKNPAVGSCDPCVMACEDLGSLCREIIAKAEGRE